MASEIIVEDGTGLADANSYTDAATARAYASLRGITLPAVPSSGVDPVEVFLILAMDYLESKRYIGFPATQAPSYDCILAPQTQALSWPRLLSSYYIGDSSQFLMPEKLIRAQCQLVIEQFNGIRLSNSTPGGPDGQFVVREKIDVIETQYSERLGTLSSPAIPAVDALLYGLVVLGGGGLRTVRV